MSTRENQQVRPWAQLDSHLQPVLQQVLSSARDATLDAIADEVPSYSDLAAEPVSANVRTGVDIALAQFITLIGQDKVALDHQAHLLYRRLGAGEWRNGRSLETLLAAFRTGARVCWSHFAAASVAAGLNAHELTILAEAIFVYIDELSAASAAGHAEAQSQDFSHRQAQRAKLASLIISGAGESTAALEIATDLGVYLPARIRVACGRDELTAFNMGLDSAQVLITSMAEFSAAVLLAEPRSWRPSTRVAVGSLVELSGAETSWAQAQRLLSLWPKSVAAEVELVRLADFHLVELVLAADSTTLLQLCDQQLEKITQLTSQKRLELSHTMLLWLLTGQDRAATAVALGVHPQTVSYRINRLRELLPQAWASPHQQLAVVVALAGEQLLRESNYRQT